MSTMLERMRSRVKERQNTFERDYSVYAFWNMKFGASSTLRLLPWSNPSTEMFWAERVMLPMQFTDPDDEVKVLRFAAPCREMYTQGEKCPILGPVRDLYTEEKELRNAGDGKEADKLKKIAGFHWKKPTFYYQGFVNKSGMTEENEPENPIRVFPLNKMIHKMVFASIFENEEDQFDVLPCGEFTEEDVKALLGEGEVDMNIFNGYSFIMKKEQQGEYANWTTGSNWSRTSSTLTDEQLAAIAEYGFWDLTKRLPDRPSDEQYDILTEMMQVSIQRQLTGENGVWDKKWEEAGFKPIKPRGQGNNNAAASQGEDAKPSSSAAKPKASGGNASSSIERLKKARGKATAAAESAPEQDESPAEVAAAADVSDEPTVAAETGVSDLAAKIKARVSKSA